MRERFLFAIASLHEATFKLAVILLLDEQRRMVTVVSGMGSRDGTCTHDARSVEELLAVLDAECRRVLGASMPEPVRSHYRAVFCAAPFTCLPLSRDAKTE